MAHKCRTVFKDISWIDGDSNYQSLVSEANVLPTEPQPWPEQHLGIQVLLVIRIVRVDGEHVDHHGHSKNNFCAHPRSCVDPGGNYCSIRCDGNQVVQDKEESCPS